MEIYLAKLVTEERRRDSLRINRDRRLATAARQARRRHRPASRA